MSKERALRRAAREAETAAAAAERARRASRRARFSRLTQPFTARRWWRRPSSGGLLAAKRRRKVGLIVLGFVILQALTWAATPDWGQRVAVLVASLFALPVVAVFML